MDISRRTVIVSGVVAAAAAGTAVAAVVIGHDDTPETASESTVGPNDNVPVPPGYAPLKAKDVDTEDFSDLVIDRSTLREGQYAPAPYPLPKDRSNWDETDYWNHGYDVVRGEAEESDQIHKELEDQEGAAPGVYGPSDGGG